MSASGRRSLPVSMTLSCAMNISQNGNASTTYYRPPRAWTSPAGLAKPCPLAWKLPPTTI
eukprot:2633103-Lingulodinium_polyedra.AAC.1